MAYINQDIGLQQYGFELYDFCNETDPRYGGLQNMSSLGEVYILKLLADPTFDMV